MQKTKLRKFLDSLGRFIKPIISESWSNRSILMISLLFGFYFTNSLISFLLDKSFNTIFLSILILLIMELLIRSSLISRFSIIIVSLNNFRIGSTYALILEAYKLGSWLFLLFFFFRSLIHRINKSLGSSGKYWFADW